VADADRYPPIGDYALIGDGRAAALVSRPGSIDWCCMPRMDHGSCFGRILDWDTGGYCSIGRVGEHQSTREYLEGSLVLATRFANAAGVGRLIDFFVVGDDDQASRLVRIVEVERGRAEVDVRVEPRFDYGSLSPWLRGHGPGVWSATGGDDALLITADHHLETTRHGISGTVAIEAGERFRLAVTFAEPEELEAALERLPDSSRLDQMLETSLQWWRDWSSQARLDGTHTPGVLRSAIVLKALANPVTGAIAAAPTTSLPEAPGGSLNWDYRYSWIRDSTFSVRSLAEIGFEAEADAFRRFVERSAAGSADGLQIMYGLGGARRLTEVTLEHLEGYRGAAPVRIGNAAWSQRQLDVYGEIVELAWRWHERGHAPDDDYWRFLLDVINNVASVWREPDRSLWEIRGEPQQFVHSKVMCWAALDRGVALAESSLRQAPLDEWRRQRDTVRRDIERHGYDDNRGIFVQAYGTDKLDAALLLLPTVGFLAWDDERMIRTVDAIQADLDDNGLLLRYRPERRLQGIRATREGVFLACTFWLAECLAHQGRVDEAEAAYGRALGAGNELGLYAEEYDTSEREPLGNFPQGLTHLSQISAAVALDRARTRTRIGQGAPA